MLAIPTLSLGSSAAATVRSEGSAANWPADADPAGRARHLGDLGFSRLHLAESERPGLAVDAGDQAREVLRYTPFQVQVELLECDERGVADLLAAGAHWIVVPLLEPVDADRLAELASVAPGRIIADLEPPNAFRTASPGRAPLIDRISAVEHLPLAGLIVTAPNAGGSPTPSTLARLELLASASPWALQARCLPDSLQALRNLEDRGVASALCALDAMPDSLDPRLVAEEFAA